MTDRERGAVVVTAASAVTQLALHTGFSAAQALADAPAQQGAMVPAGSQAGMQHAGSGHGASVGMVLAHVAAGLLCGLWLGRGEVAAFRLGRALAGFLFAPLVLACRVFMAAGAQRPVAPAPAADPELRRLRRRPLRHVLSRRGPPVRLSCV